MKIDLSRKGISPIIAALILALIPVAIVASVIVYANVVGFVGIVGGNQTEQISVISVENFCVSASTKCTNAKGYYLTILNAGSTTIPLSETSVYFTDVSSGSAATATCAIASPVAPGSTYSCSGTSLSGFSQGQVATVKVVDQDSGDSISSTKVIS